MEHSLQEHSLAFPWVQRSAQCSSQEQWAKAETGAAIVRSEAAKQTARSFDMNKSPMNRIYSGNSETLEVSTSGTISVGRLFRC